MTCRGNASKELGQVEAGVLGFACSIDQHQHRLASILILSSFKAHLLEELKQRVEKTQSQVNFDAAAKCRLQFLFDHSATYLASYFKAHQRWLSCMRSNLKMWTA